MSYAKAVKKHYAKSPIKRHIMRMATNKQKRVKRRRRR